MRNLFIQAKSKLTLDDESIENLISKVPKKISIAYSIQFKSLAEKVRELFSKELEVIDFVQVLGCASPKFNKKAEAIVLIGSGRFHSVSLAYESKLPVYLLENGRLELISEKEVETLEKRRKGAMMNFLNSKIQNK